MTRHKRSESLPKIREGRSPGEREPTVVRPGDEPSWAEEFWREQNDPKLPKYHRWSKRLHGQLMGNLSDEAFLTSMRNRLRFLGRERAAPAFWRRFKGLLFGSPEDNAMAGFEIKRLKHLAGEAPPESLPDHHNFNLPYDDFLRLVSAAESNASPAAATTEPQDRTA